MNFLLVCLLIIIPALLVLLIWRLRDALQIKAIWQDLINKGNSKKEVFDLEQIRPLPEPVRRFFQYSIKPGTVIQKTVELEMIGELGLGTKTDPRYLTMRARQILSAPIGFIWKVSAGQGFKFIAGSDAAYLSKSWSKFWYLGIIPVVRAGGNTDHFKSSFGRYMGEAVFWLPASLLPAENVEWQQIDSDVIRVKIEHHNMIFSADITLSKTGQPTEIKFERWSNANSDKEFRSQSFGGYLSDFKLFDGYMLPTKIEAGNLFDTDDYFPFYKATITDVCFPSKKG